MFFLGRLYVALQIVYFNSFLCFSWTHYPCWSKNCYQLDNFRLHRDCFLQCRFSKFQNSSVKKNLFFFFIFDDFQGVSFRYLWLLLMLPVLFSLLLPNGFGCPIPFLWSSRITDIIAFLGLNLLFRKSIWSFKDFIFLHRVNLIYNESLHTYHFHT